MNLPEYVAGNTRLGGNRVIKQNNNNSNNNSNNKKLNIRIFEGAVPIWKSTALGFKLVLTLIKNFSC